MQLGVLSEVSLVFKGQYWLSEVAFYPSAGFSVFRVSFSKGFSYVISLICGE